VIYEWPLQEKGYDSSQLRGYDRFRIALRYAVQS
jgi:hypothetical protein